MDSPIQKSRWQKSKTPVFIFAGVAIMICLWLVAIPKGSKTLTVGSTELDIATVSEDVFEDFIPVRGQIMPLRTVYLDSIEGGRVEAIHLEDGSEVAKGQSIVDISNSSLQLNAFSLETQVSEQLFNMQSQELRLVQNQLAQKRELNDVGYQILQSEDKLARLRPLIKSGSVRVSELKDSENEMNYLLLKKKLMEDASRTDQQLQLIQMKSIREAVSHLQSNLAYAKNNLANLNVKAPIAGRLTAFNLEIGQSIKPGERFGQIDDPINVKLVALVDEFYLPRLFVGQTGQVDFQNSSFPISIRKIYPQVTKGQFQVDLVFNNKPPENLHRGQSMQVRLQLGESVKTLQIPSGSFYQDTGGTWIFVINKNKTTAIKRSIKLGRRNSHVIEVLDGLSKGEQVIVSSYSGYLNFDSLDINLVKSK